MRGHGPPATHGAAARRHDGLARRELHAPPETAFQEVRTAAFVAERLAAFGLEVARGIGRTGVVGTLRAGAAARAVGLRADMDAPYLTEQNGFAHRSRHAGRMHACGHDRHTAMLLGAARYLAATRSMDCTTGQACPPGSSR